MKKMDSLAPKEIEDSGNDTSQFLIELLGNLFTRIRESLHREVGYSELLQSGIAAHLSVEQQQLLQEMSRNTGHLIRLLDEISDLSFVYTKHRTLRKDQIDIIQLIHDTAETFRQEHQHYQIDLRYQLLAELSNSRAEPTPRILKPERIYQEFQPLPFYLELDQELIRTALQELLQNACDYTEGPIVIKLAAQSREGQFSILVSDQGIGLASEGGEALFTPFSRGVRGHALHPHGIGLGLARVKAYMEAHGGKLSLLPTTKGTTLSLDFPVAHEEEEAEIYFNEEVKKIILFQENPEELELYQYLLEFNFYDVLGLTERETLLAAMGKWEADLILLDSHCQQRLTLDLVQEIIAAQQGLEIPIVILASDPAMGIEQHFFKVGVQGYVAKPVEYNQLIMLINHLLRTPANLL